MFSNKVYDFLKAIAQFILPAIITLYATLGDIWGLPYVVQISATLAAVNTFLGILLGISSHNYIGDGVIQIDPDELPHETETEFDSKITLNASGFDLLNKDRVILQVERTDKKEK